MTMTCFIPQSNAAHPDFCMWGPIINKRSPRNEVYKIIGTNLHSFDIPLTQLEDPDHFYRFL